MKVKFKKTHPDAKEPFKKYNEDFCYDLYATSCEQIAPNVYKYGLGLAFEINRNVAQNLGYMFNITMADQYINQEMIFHNTPIILSLDFRPRSSIWKTGMVLSNCTGTIDELYRGEVSAVFYHVMPNMPKYEVGDRVIQCKIGFTFPIEWKEVEELSETKRGKNGYGHTGRK